MFELHWGAWQAWLGAHPDWLGAAVFLIALVECLALVGLLIPGVTLLFAVAALAGSGALGLGETLLLAWCGALLGDGLSYLLGRLFHQRIRQLPPLRRHPHWLVAAELYMQRYGAAGLLIGRFIGPLRPLLPMTAGMLDMPAGRFAALSLLASSGWALAYVLPGWSTGAALRLPLPEDAWWHLLLALLPGALGVWGLLHRRQTPRSRRRWLLCGALLAASLLGLGLLAWQWLGAMPPR